MSGKSSVTNSSQRVWMYAGSSLLGIVLLVATKQYFVASILIYASVGLFSLKDPVLGVVLSIAFFTCDQLLIGIGIGHLAPGRYLIFINIIFCAKGLLSSKSSKFTRVHFGLYFLLAALGAMSLTWASDVDRGILYLSKLTVLIIWARLVVPYLSNRSALENLSALMPLATFVVAFNLMFGDVSVTTMSHHRLILEGLGINAVAISFGFVIMFSSLYLSGSAPLWKKAIIAFCNVVIYFAVLKMGTRSVALGIPLSLFVGLLFLESKKLLKGAGIVLISTTVLAITLYIAINNNLITGKLAERFTGLTEIDTYSENSRFSLISHSLSYVARNPHGSGVGNEHMVFKNYVYKVDLFETHNTLVSTMVQFGVIGFLIQLIAFGYLGYHAITIKNSTYRYVLLACLIYFFIQIMKGSSLQTRLFWIPMAVICGMLEFHIVNAILKQRRLSPLLKHYKQVTKPKKLISTNRLS